MKSNLPLKRGVTPEKALARTEEIILLRLVDAVQHGQDEVARAYRHLLMELSQKHYGSIDYLPERAAAYGVDCHFDVPIPIRTEQ